MKKLKYTGQKVGDEGWTNFRSTPNGKLHQLINYCANEGFKTYVVLPTTADFPWPRVLVR